MSRVVVEETACDVCGYQSEARGWFVHVRGHDLCGSVCGSVADRGVLECGRHVVSLTGDSWACSCGQVFEQFRIQAEARWWPISMFAPSPVAASARLHVDGEWRGWP